MRNRSHALQKIKVASKIGKYGTDVTEYESAFWGTTVVKTDLRREKNKLKLVISMDETI